MQNNKALVKAFLKAIENRTLINQLDQFYHPKAEQIEYPNTLTKQVAHRTLDELKAALGKGQSMLEKENYDIKKMFAVDDIVIIECVWKGTLANTQKELTAYFAQFFEFNGGKIIKQRNYDCFEPF